MTNPKTTPRGFTLVELLVVIGIIALLISILLPVLSRAREAANAAKCSANMRSAMQAVLIYVSESKGWLPGPHTSGRMWGIANLDDIGPGEITGKAAPVQNMDWASPSLGRVLNLPEEDLERTKSLWRTELYCPSSNAVFNHLGLGAAGIDPSDFRYASYAAVLQFHIWPQREVLNVPRIGIKMGNGAIFDLPAAYGPQITKVGDASRKVFLIEGARYVEDLGNGNAKLSLNLARYQIEGGNYMVGGPFMYYQDTPHILPVGYGDFDGRVSVMNTRFAWRHRGRMNLAFMDGHVESRDVRDSLSADLYLPKETVIRPGGSSMSYDPNDKDGMIVQ